VVVLTVCHAVQPQTTVHELEVIHGNVIEDVEQRSVQRDEKGNIIADASSWSMGLPDGKDFARAAAEQHKGPGDAVCADKAFMDSLGDTCEAWSTTKCKQKDVVPKKHTPPARARDIVSAKKACCVCGGGSTVKVPARFVPSEKKWLRGMSGTSSAAGSQPSGQANVKAAVSLRPPPAPPLRKVHGTEHKLQQKAAKHHNHGCKGSLCKTEHALHTVHKTAQDFPLWLSLLGLLLTCLAICVGAIILRFLGRKNDAKVHVPESALFDEEEACHIGP